MVQYSNRAKTCQQSEKDVTVLKQGQNLSRVKKRMVQFSNRTNLSPFRKRWYNTQTGPKPVKSQKRMVQFSNRTNLSPVRKRWYNTEKVQKPVSSQKNMVQYSNRAKTCHQSEKDVKYSNRAKTCQESKKDGAILKQNKGVTT